jgi:SAM-dependent methyltransferase
VVDRSAALVGILRTLKDRGYNFTCVTPSTHARILARPCKDPDLRDIFGWNRPFRPADLEPHLLKCLKDADALGEHCGMLKTRIRVASLGDDLFLHSGFPTSDADSVFLGPDTQRFIRFVCKDLACRNSRPSWIVEMGCGTAAAAIAAAKLARGARISCVDVNPAALELAQANAVGAGVDVEVTASSFVPPGADLVIANPPYMMDEARRTYRDGGALLGGEVALDWVRQSLNELAPGGRMLLYTGVSIVRGRAPLIHVLHEECDAKGAELRVDEVDPDVFGEELDRPVYASVERIALIEATITKRSES